MLNFSSLHFSRLGRWSLGCAGAIAALLGITASSCATEVALTSIATDAAVNTTSAAYLKSSLLHQWVAQVSAELALARHLRAIDARMYGAYWCPYCSRQEDLFGNAFSEINYIECDPRGENAQPQLCRSASVQGYPTWEINGQFYPGMRSLQELANLSGYRGSTNFSQ